MHDIYNKKNIPISDSHPIYKFITTDKMLQHYIILNNKNVIGALFVGSDGRFYVVSSFAVRIDGQIYSTIGILLTQYVLIVLSDDSLRNIITLVDYDKDSNVLPFKLEEVETKDNETTPFIINTPSKFIREP